MASRYLRHFGGFHGDFGIRDQHVSVNCRKITPEASYLADSNINSREITLGNFGVVELPLLEVSAS